MLQGCVVEVAEEALWEQNDEWIVSVNTFLKANDLWSVKQMHIEESLIWQENDSELSFRISSSESV